MKVCSIARAQAGHLHLYQKTSVSRLSSIIYTTGKIQNRDLIYINKYVFVCKSVINHNHKCFAKIQNNKIQQRAEIEIVPISKLSINLAMTPSKISREEQKNIH